MGDASEGMTDFCVEPNEHEEKGGSPGAGVQCELSLRIDMEAVRRGCFTNDADETSSSAVAALLEAQVLQLTRADSETADTGTSNATVERSPYGRSGGVDSVSVLYREQSTETRQKFATHAKSRHDLGVPLPMQPEGLAYSVKTLQQLITQSMKASENVALSILKARGLSALTANEGPDTGTSNATVERLPYGRSGGVDSVCVLYREQSTETRQNFATHAKSWHDLGVPLPMQPEGLASSVKTLQQLSTQSMKASENMALSIVKARGLSALTANEGRKLDRQQRKRNVTVLNACAAPIFDRRWRVRVFDPGGRR
ncbi:hypothetical protein V5799_010341 [Amblyomma americanum]|uniref:Uncharacterized protein n=1 Tax=Amblyomma americanum TaxID=6943 RepID=A0AAQ4F7Y3_AMBAM